MCTDVTHLKLYTTIEGLYYIWFNCRVDEKTKEKIGKDLAAAYVVVKSGGRIQFAGMDRWIEKKGNHIPLPNYNIPNLKLQVADLTASHIRYEGLAFLGKNQIGP